MSVLSTAIGHIKQVIPEQVLQAAFIQPVPMGIRTPLSLDALIKANVLVPKVVRDCNLVSGVVRLIPLMEASQQWVDQYNLILDIPKSVTDGRSIVAPLNITMYNYQYNVGTSVNNPLNRPQNPLLDAAKSVYDSVATPTIVTSAHVNLIGENIILVGGTGYNVGTSALLCILENEQEMNNIQPHTMPTFFQLCALAAKSIIYNRLIVRMDSAAIMGGFSLGALKNIVESYSDAEQMYQDFLVNTWQKTAMLNDSQAKFRHLKMISGSRW